MLFSYKSEVKLFSDINNYYMSHYQIRTDANHTIDNWFLSCLATAENSDCINQWVSDALRSSNAADFKRDFKPAGELTTSETFAEVSARNLALKLEVLQSRLASTKIEITHELEILGDTYEALRS